MKVVLIGGLNAKILAQELGYYGISTQTLTSPLRLLSFRYRDFKIVYGSYLMPIRQILCIKSLRKKLIVHVVGSDAFQFAAKMGLKKRLWKFALGLCDGLLYVSEEIKQLVGLDEGTVLPIPIDTRMFKKRECENIKRDLLYYCPDIGIYRLDWILRYANDHPEQTITIIGCPVPVSLPNVQVLPFVAYDQMPALYNRHRRLIRMTTHDGYPKMPYEALLSGLEVVWNGRRVTEVPAEMRMEATIPKLISVVESLLESSSLVSS